MHEDTEATETVLIDEKPEPSTPKPKPKPEPETREEPKQSDEQADNSHNTILFVLIAVAAIGGLFFVMKRKKQSASGNQ